MYSVHTMNSVATLKSFWSLVECFELVPGSFRTMMVKGSEIHNNLRPVCSLCSFFLVTFARPFPPFPKPPLWFWIPYFSSLFTLDWDKIILYICTNNTVASVPFSLPIEPSSSNNCPALSEFRRIKAKVETGHLYGSTEYIWTLLYLSLEVTFTPPPEEEEIFFTRARILIFKSSREYQEILCFLFPLLF